MSFTRMEDPTPQDLNDSLVSVIKADIADAQSYHDSVIDPAVKRRYEIYYADKDYYTKKFPQLSKYSSIVSTDVTDRTPKSCRSYWYTSCKDRTGSSPFCTTG